MQAKIFTGLIGVMLISSVAFASPSAPLQQGETSIGFDVTNLQPSISMFGLKQDLGSTNANSYYLQHGLTDKVTLGVESTKLDDFSSNNGGVFANVKATDIYAQYNIDDHFGLIAGNRNYNTTVGYSGTSTSISNDKFLWGVTGSTNLSDKLTGHAFYKKTAAESEWQVGIADQLSNNISVDLNYKNHDYNFGSADLNLSGVGLGVNYKF